jgi:hypothetical protein
MTGYGDGVLSDARIAAMSPDERRDLIQRLQRPLDEVFPPPVARRFRRTRLTLMVGGSIALIPWIVYLGFSLPANYVAQNWPATWMGFDCLLVAFMAATAVLGWLRRQLVLLTAFTTGVLLISDAWFDILTAGLGRDLAVPMLSAALGNLPLAAIMITGALRILRLTAIRLFFSRPRDAAVAPALAAVTGPGASRLKCSLASRCQLGIWHSQQLDVLIVCPWAECVSPQRL